jgi:hypothetical protein
MQHRSGPKTLPLQATPRPGLLHHLRIQSRCRWLLLTRRQCEEGFPRHAKRIQDACSVKQTARPLALVGLQEERGECDVRRDGTAKHN